MCNVDCNECYYLNTTEYEQRNKTIPHICKLFKKRVIHRANKSHHEGYLYPHNLCNGEHFKSRDYKKTEAKIKELEEKAGNFEKYRKDYLGMLTWDELFNEIDSSVSERMKEIEQEMYKSLAISADILYNKAKEDEERWKKYI